MRACVCLSHCFSLNITSGLFCYNFKDCFVFLDSHVAGAETGGSDDSDDEVLVPQQQATDDDYSSINIILDEGEKESSAQINGGDVIQASKTSLDVNDATGEDRASLRKGKHKHVLVCMYTYMYILRSTNR